MNITLRKIALDLYTLYNYTINHRIYTRIIYDINQKNVIEFINKHNYSDHPKGYSDYLIIESIVHHSQPDALYYRRN